MQFIIVDKATGIKSEPVSIDWFLFGEDDLEFANGESLPLSDFKFFRDDYNIVLKKVTGSTRVRRNKS